MKLFSKKKFTLLELLCGVCILLILFSLLLVTANKIYNRAKKAHNINNLKQIGHAIQMYMMDHDGSYPYLSKSISDSRCLFLLLPYMNYSIQLFFPPNILEKRKHIQQFNAYMKDPAQLINDIKSGQISPIYYPGYAYSAIKEGNIPLMDQNLFITRTPVVTNFKGTYENEIYILYPDGSVARHKSIGEDECLKEIADKSPTLYQESIKRGDEEQKQ